jgi:hypothetical protein
MTTLPARGEGEDVDGRVKPGHDEIGWLSGRRTAVALFLEQAAGEGEVVGF